MDTYKHLSQEQRIEIQECLNHGISFKSIARRIGVDPTTVSREVKRHLSIRPSCVIRTDSSGNASHTICAQLLKPPFLCNPCKLYHRSCAFDKHIYLAVAAQKEYEKTLREAREGIPLTKEQFYRNDQIISDGVRKGQHIYHILQTNNLNVSSATVYRHIQKGYMSVSAIDLPRAVKFKPRKKGYAPYIPKAAKVGRTYADFQLYCAETGTFSWVEMDTVIGRIGGKVILTFDFTFCNFMFGILLPDKSAASVTAAVQELKKQLAEASVSFGEIFPIILTDNGGEFANISAVEKDAAGNPETKLFFCDPAQASQKPHVEKNHSLLRDIIPQGTSFDEFNQETINLIFSHVNGVKRKLLHGKSPYDLFSFTVGATIAGILGVYYIPPEHVVQSPKLLKT